MLDVTKEDVVELLSFMLDADFNEQLLKCYPKEIYKINDICNTLTFEDCPAEVSCLKFCSSLRFWRT